MRYDIVIIGAGPAGISAAITGTLRNKNVLLIGDRWGQHSGKPEDPSVQVEIKL